MAGIMEKNLPVAESLGEGDKVRIVTSEGNSKQIDASKVGKDIEVITITQNGDTVTSDTHYNDIYSMITAGKLVFAHLLNNTGGSMAVVGVFPVYLHYGTVDFTQVVLDGHHIHIYEYEEADYAYAWRMNTATIEV